MSEHPQLSSASYTFTQDGNMVGSTSDLEELTICLETQLPGDPPFFVLRTSTGWSIDSIDELAALIERCKVTVDTPTPPATE